MRACGDERKMREESNTIARKYYLKNVAETKTNTWICRIEGTYSEGR